MKKKTKVPFSFEGFGSSSTSHLTLQQSVFYCFRLQFSPDFGGLLHLEYFLHIIFIVAAAEILIVKTCTAMRNQVILYKVKVTSYYKS